MILSLLNLANYTAFSVIVSLSTFGLFQSYLIAIVCGLTARLSGRFKEVSSEFLHGYMSEEEKKKKLTSTPLSRPPGPSENMASRSISPLSSLPRG